MDYSQRLQLLNFLVMLAQADGSVPGSEVDALRGISRCMGMADADLDSMLKLTGGTLDDAYAVLGVPPTATDDEVRRAYASSPCSHHPDRVAALGDDIRRAAEKKFQEINEAKRGGVFDSRNGTILKICSLIDVGEHAGSGIAISFTYGACNHRAV